MSMNKKPLLKKRGFLYLFSCFIEFKIINIVTNDVILISNRIMEIFHKK